MKLKPYILFLLLVVNIALPQNYNWITPNQAYLKMYVVNDGIYRINKTDFSSAGVNPDVIDPRTVKVYYKGNQQPIYFFGEEDGVFNDADYLDFYGKRNYGGLTNTYNADNQLFYATDEYYNIYSDTSVYWIGWGGAYGTRFVNYNYTSYISYPFEYYYKKLHFENDLVYSYGEQINTQDYRCFNNEKFQGEGWYWQMMQFFNSNTQNFNTPYLVTYLQSSIKIFAYPQNQNTSVYNEHRVPFVLNNNLIDTLRANDFTRIDTTLYFPSTYLNGSSSNTMVWRYTPFSFNGGKLYFDMFEISYPSRFEFDNNYIGFSTNSSDSTSKIYKIKGYNSTNPINIYDVKNGHRISNYTLSADTIKFTGKGDGAFEVLNKYITLKPFRIKQKQVPNFVSTSNGVDYLVVYNKVFESQAEQLRSYRNTHDGFRSVKAEMEDIYDIFNYGIENPIAIRNFVKYVYDNWTVPKVSYICLLGRASLDPKKNLTSSVYYQNYIPTYGNPPSDGYLANFNYGTFTYNQHVAIGRIPAYTSQEAQDAVNKIILYESQPLNEWIKKSIFITGGHYTSDQLQLRDQSNTYLNSNIIVPPLSMDATKIYLNDTSGVVTYNYSDSVKNSINRGALFVSFMGHSSYQYWDNIFSNPGVLNNANLFPLIFSMTCYTGRNAETNARGYGEQFLFLPNKGAIGFVSTTGWSFFPGGGNIYEQFFLNSISSGSMRRLGDMMKFASLSMAPDSAIFSRRNTINSYNLLGDPALKLLLPNYPEFDIRLSDYSFLNPRPAVREMISLKIFPKNLGTYADSCKVRFQLLRNGQNHGIKDTIVRNWGFVDTIVNNFRIDTVGNYFMKVILDVDNWYTQESTANNTVSIPINLKNAAFVPIKPIDNSIIKGDTVELVGINPNINTTTNTVKLIVQLDSSISFNSSLSQTYYNNNMTGAATKFKVRIPILDSNIVYYWRLNAIVNNNDTLGWSEIKKFKYNITLPADFSGGDSKDSKSDMINPDWVQDSNITVYKNKLGQYNSYELSYVNGDNNGLKTTNFTGYIEAAGWGGDPWEATSFTVNGYSQTLTRPQIDWNGIYLIKVSKITGNILSKLHVYLSTATSNDSILAYLNSFNSDNILMALKLIYNGFAAYNLSTDVKNKFIQFGSTKMDSLNFLSWVWDRWSFISYPNNPNPIVSESFIKTVWAPAISSMQPTFINTNGSITHIIGPAKVWKNFSWQQTLYTGTSIKFDVYGVDRNNAETLLLPNITTNIFVDLQSINSYTYPYLKLITKLNIDTSTGTQSPVFQSLKFNYVAPSEIALDYNTFIKSDSLINRGDSLGISLAYYNVGYVNLNGYTRDIYVYSNTGQKVVLKSDLILSTLKIDSVHYVKTSVKFGGLPFIRKYNNYIPVYFEVTPYGTQNDLYTYNNINATNVVVKGTSQNYTMELYSDGFKISGGEFVRSKPNIEIKLKSESLSGISSFDTSDFRLYINNKYQPYYTRTSNGLTIEGINGRSGNISIKCNPELPNGENIFKLVSRKSSEIDFDTLQYSVLVSNQLMIKDFYNYPNPMKNQTGFIFNLGGNSPPSGCKIKIYTVSGRVVKIINTSANIGFNQINWDGRDNEGDYMANGVYFYRMIIEGDTKIESAIQKLVILK